METVKSLRQKGWKVNIFHYNEGNIRLGHSKEYRKISGATLARVLDDEGKEWVGLSFCVEPNFSRKTGVRIALGRALKNRENGEKHLPFAEFEEITIRGRKQDDLK